jgi:hypothetical protein
MQNYLSQIELLVEDIREFESISSSSIDYELQKAINALRNVLSMLEDNL